MFNIKIKYRVVLAIKIIHVKHRSLVLFGYNLPINTNHNLKFKFVHRNLTEKKMSGSIRVIGIQIIFTK